MSSIGTILKLTTFGESHSKAVGGILEGFPSGFFIDFVKMQKQVDRRRAQGTLSTPRQEEDRVIILSGFQEGITLGTPIGFMVNNNDIRTRDYDSCQKGGEAYIPRPSHADYTYLKKYGIHAKSGGGRSSARETIARVVAGAIAEQYLEQVTNCRVVAWVSNIGGIESKYVPKDITRDDVDLSLVRCPDLKASKKMITAINKIKEQGDSLGGIINCQVINPPVGLGEPCFDKLEARLSMAMMSIPATKAFEIGEGFNVSNMTGLEHNDCFECVRGEIRPMSNHSGGTLGGISNGSNICFRLAVKPPSSIQSVQKTVNMSGEEVEFSTIGRHDPCVVQRAVAIVEAMTALTLMDFYLLQKSKHENTT